MANLCDKFKYRFKNYFEIKKNHVNIIIFSLKYGYKKIKIDLDDLDMIITRRWTLKKDRNTFYVQSYEKKKNILMHRFILSYEGDLFIDHENRNGLDNRKKNLRIVSNKINCRNTKNTDSENRNVKYLEKGNYKAYIVRFAGLKIEKSFNIKNYKSKKKAYDAARKYADDIRIKHGYKEKLNIIKIKKI